MEIQGKIITVLPLRTGISKASGNEWQSQEYVIETRDSYPRKCCFRVFGNDRIKQFDIHDGDELVVSIYIEAHEYNGRWYNNVNAWAVKRLSEIQRESSEKKGNTETTSEKEAVDDLPF